MRLDGKMDPEARTAMGLRQLNLAVDEEARAQLQHCCGSSEWLRRVVAARPFRDVSELLEKSAAVWSSLGREDWLEAFKSHPKIGGSNAAVAQSSEAKKWSEQEQSSIAVAKNSTLEALAQINAEYEARFGFIYIVCATGKSADEMLDLAKQRLANDPSRELQIAADEQGKITDLRLRKLVSK